MGSPQRRTTSCLLGWDFNEQPIFGVRGNRHAGLRFPQKKGHQFGRWTLQTNKVFRSPQGYRYAKVKCRCGTVSFRDHSGLVKGLSLGCDPCAHADRKFCRAPRWLVKRMEMAKDRCTNCCNPMFKHYGERGIEFRFKSAIHAANWILDNLGLKRHLTLDRRNNDGHYEPGNLRYATQREQVLNSRVEKLDVVYQADDWPYCEQTTMRYLRQGMTRTQVLQQAELAVREKRKGWRRIKLRLELMTY